MTDSGSMQQLPVIWRPRVLGNIPLGPSITLTSSDLVRNWFQRVTISLQDILDVRAGYSGVTIKSTGRRPVCASAVQKSNASTWLNRRTRADEVVETIRAAAREASTRLG
ncbi:MAG TPA: hypothetical protein VF070_06845 [Streptosporangiaceae bacterium]